MCAKVVKVDKHNNLARVTDMSRLKCWSHECGLVRWGRGGEGSFTCINNMYLMDAIFVQSTTAYIEIFMVDKFLHFSLVGLCIIPPRI